VEPHQVLVGRLGQRVVPQQALGHLDRRRVLVLLFVKLDQLLKRCQKELLETLALGQNPIVVAARQQIAAIDLGRLLQGDTGRDLVAGLLGQRQRLLKISDI
jgi:hypothetical protein